MSLRGNLFNVSSDVATSDGILHISHANIKYVLPFDSVTTLVCGLKFAGGGLVHIQTPMSPALDPRTCFGEIIQSYRRVAMLPAL